MSTKQMERDAEAQKYRAARDIIPDDVCELMDKENAHLEALENKAQRMIDNGADMDALLDIWDEIHEYEVDIRRCGSGTWFYASAW